MRKIMGKIFLPKVTCYPTDCDGVTFLNLQIPLFSIKMWIFHFPEGCNDHRWSVLPVFFSKAIQCKSSESITRSSLFCCLPGSYWSSQEHFKDVFALAWTGWLVKSISVSLLTKNTIKKTDLTESLKRGGGRVRCQLAFQRCFWCCLEAWLLPCSWPEVKLSWRHWDGWGIMRPTKMMSWLFQWLWSSLLVQDGI